MKAKTRRDISVIEHFTPEQVRNTITDADREAFAAWSSAGVRCEATPGFDALALGKTYRDAMVAMLRVDLAEGIFWRHEFSDPQAFPPDVGAYLDKATKGVVPRPDVLREVARWKRTVCQQP